LCDTLSCGESELGDHDRFRGHGGETAVQVLWVAVCGDGLFEGGSIIRIQVYADPVYVLISWIVLCLIDSIGVGVVGAPDKEDIGGSCGSEDVTDTNPRCDELGGCVAVHISPWVPCAVELVQRS